MPQRLKFFLHNRKQIWQSRRSLQPLNYDLERFMNYELDAHTNDIKRQLDSLAAHNTDLSQQLAN